jgi:hypothetical protein
MLAWWRNKAFQAPKGTVVGLEAKFIDAIGYYTIVDRLSLLRDGCLKDGAEAGNAAVGSPSAVQIPWLKTDFCFAHCEA